ncbi:MAG: DNA methyltransferase [Acidimicrobiales bacterium]
MSDTSLTAVRHPAKFSPSIMDLIATLLIPPDALVLDPFAGTGRIHEIGTRCGARTVGVEIEREWASLADQTIVADAIQLPFPSNIFDIAATSPTYANRLADHHQARDGSVRHSYTHDLGRSLHPNNSGAMQWGEPYKCLHQAAWAEVLRVLRPGGSLVLNISDHIRGGVIQPVTDWHVQTLQALQFTIVEHYLVPTPRLRYGKHSAVRVPHESVILFTAPG